jgi:hypothetical protein
MIARGCEANECDFLRHESRAAAKVCRVAGVVDAAWS